MGVSWPPWKNGWKIKKRKHAKKQGGRRYADRIFIQIYFRMHHFVVKFSKFFSPQAARGHWPPNQNPADALWGQLNRRITWRTLPPIIPTETESVPKIIMNNTIIFKKKFFSNCDMYLYFSTRNGQPMEPALCRLYRHTFVPYIDVVFVYLDLNDFLFLQISDSQT